MGISTGAMRSCLGKPGLLHMQPLFFYSVKFETNHGSSFQPTSSCLFVSSFCHATPRRVFRLHLKARVLNVSESGEQISSDQLTPGEKNPWIDGRRVAAKRTTSCNKWNLNQPKCGQMKKWHGAWQETCILGICNSRTVVYLQRSRNSKLWKVAFRHVAQNENKFCCKKVDIA